MRRFHTRDNKKVWFTAAQEAARDVEEAQQIAEKPERDRPKVYAVAQSEFTRRALLVANVNGPQTDKTLNLTWNRFKRTSDPRADQIDAIDDNRVSLIDGIEAAADPSTIDPTAEEHWT